MDNGDERYGVGDTDYYHLVSTLEPSRGEIPVIGIEDTEAGYIAFATEEAQAAKIVDALRRHDSPLNVLVSRADLVALLDYAQADEEHDFEMNDEAGDFHVVHAIRRLRASAS